MTPAEPATVPSAPTSPPWRAGMWAVVPLSVVAVAAFFETIHLSNAFDGRVSSGCRYLYLPWTNYASAYAGLLAAVGAVVLFLMLHRAARRAGADPSRGVASGVATLFVAFAALMVLLDAGVVVITHLQGAEAAAEVGKTLCEG